MAEAPIRTGPDDVAFCDDSELGYRRSLTDLSVPLKWLESGRAP